MKHFMIILAVFLGVVSIVLGVSFFTPLPVPYYQDFSVMYFTDYAFLKGIPVYSYAQQLTFIKNLTPVGFTFLPFPYPPWYPLATIFLGLLPVQVAARVWFFCNLAMLGLSAWLLTPDWKTIYRIFACAAAALFIPAFGLLVVGQYSAPVLLGASLFIYAARQESPLFSALSLWLMTFKPHIGIFLFLAGLVWLILVLLGSITGIKGSFFARRAIWYTIIGGLFLISISFLADPAWPLAYLKSLSLYRDIPGVQTCAICASLSVVLVKLITGQSNTTSAVWVSLGLVIPLGMLVFWRLRSGLKDPVLLMALFSVLTLLLDPYLLNYDFILLLIPLFWLARRVKLFALALYFVPCVALFFGRDSNIFFAIVAVVTLILILKFPLPYSPIWD